MSETQYRSLRTASVLFLAGFVLHNADHARRGLSAIHDEVVWSGTFVAVVAAVTLTLVFTRHAAAPLAATATGFATAAGVSASHLLPTWSALSDSLPDGNVDGWTWVAVLAEIVGALVLGAAGLRVLRHPASPTARSSADSVGRSMSSGRR